MKLRAKQIPHSGIVGGGLLLTDNNSGAAMFMISFMGTSQGITKEETEALSEQIEALINAHGLSVPKRR